MNFISNFVRKRLFRFQKVLKKLFFPFTKKTFLSDESNIELHKMGRKDYKSSIYYFKRILSHKSVSTTLKIDTIRNLILEALI